MLKRIYVGSEQAPMVPLLKLCLHRGITVHIHHRDGKVNLVVNLQTPKREARMLPIFKDTEWKHYHHPASNSIHKSVVFEDIRV